MYSNNCHFLLSCIHDQVLKITISFCTYQFYQFKLLFMQNNLGRYQPKQAYQLLCKYQGIVFALCKINLQIYLCILHDAQKSLNQTKKLTLSLHLRFFYLPAVVRHLIIWPFPSASSSTRSKTKNKVYEQNNRQGNRVKGQNKDVVVVSLFEPCSGHNVFLYLLLQEALLVLMKPHATKRLLYSLSIHNFKLLGFTLFWFFVPMTVMEHANHLYR